MKRDPKGEPVHTWHWARCEDCGDSLSLRSDQFDPDSLMPGCCGGNGGRRGDENQPGDFHAIEDVLRRPVCCADCGYRREFGEPPVRPDKESETDMARKKKHENGHGDPEAVVAADANGVAHEQVSDEDAAPPPVAPAPVRTEPVKRRVYEEKLPVQVGDDIIAPKGLALANKVHLRARWREEWKTRCAEAPEKRAAFDQEIEQLAAEVDGKVEFRNVEVEEWLMPDNEVRIIRKDTGEVIDRRTATSDDLQEALFDGEKAAKPALAASHDEPKTGDVTDPAAILAATEAPELDPGSAEALFGA